MNKVELIGRLAATPELRTTTSGKNVCDFTLAADRVDTVEKQADFVRVPVSESRSDFIRCTAWGKLADVLCRYKKQGDQIAVMGSLRVDKYTDKNGNDRYKNYVLVSELEFLGKAPARDQQNGQIPEDDFPFN